MPILNPRFADAGALAARILLEHWADPSRERLLAYQEHWDAGHRKTWGTMRLIERARERVRITSGVRLALEVKLWGYAGG